MIMKKILINIGLFFLIQAFVQAQTSGDTAVYTRFYYPDSILSAEGWMRQGNPDGYWKSYYPDATLRSEGNRKDFLLDSTWKFYNEQGDTQMLVHYKEGKKHGLRRVYLEDEIVEVTFHYDTIKGFENHYDYQSHLILSIPYEKGIPQGLAKHFDTLGNIIAVVEYHKGYVIKREYINRLDEKQWKQGNWKLFWRNGNLQMEGYYVNNKKYGFFKYYDENGNFQQIEKWENDKLIEDAVETKKLERKLAYHPNGKIKTEAYFFKDKPEGIRREYDSNGVVIQSYIFKNARLIGEGIVDENGLKQGLWREYYEENGALKSSGLYVNSKPVGEWKYYFPEGNLELTGRFDKQGRKDGEWMWYYPDRVVLMIENYFSGIYDGLQISFDEKGDTIALEMYTDGLENGRWIYWNDSVLEERFYLDGQKHGEWKTYYPSSKLKISARFEFDFQEGKTIHYWENGRKKAEYNYSGGLLDGYAFQYDENGNLLFSTTYNKGIEIEYGGVKVTPTLDPDELSK